MIIFDSRPINKLILTLQHAGYKSITPPTRSPAMCLSHSQSLQFSDQVCCGGSKDRIINAQEMIVVSQARLSTRESLARETRDDSQIPGFIHGRPLHKNIVAGP